jgi:PII-like signaling protein
MALKESMILLRIYLNENDRAGHRPLHEAIADLLTAAGVGGITVFRGIAGTGMHHTWHSDRLLELSGSLPMLVEAVAAEEMITPLLPQLETLMQGGLITLLPVTAVRPGSAGKPEGPGA